MSLQHGQGRLPYGEWRLQAYRTATLLWASTLVCAYTTTLYRMPMGLSAQVLLLSSLHLLTCLTLVTAVRGSTACLRASTTALMVTRSVGYIGIGMGWIPLNFKRQTFSFSAHTADFPLATFGYMAALLFDTIGLVHAHVPRLQLLLQTLASIISSLSVGNSAVISIIKSCAVHGLCGVIYAMLEHRDLRCYTALLEAQKPGAEHEDPQRKPKVLDMQGSSSMSTADGANCVSLKTLSATAADGNPHGAQDAPFTRNSDPFGPSSDAILSPAEVAAVLDPGAHLDEPPERHTMPTDAANSLPSFSAPMLRSLSTLPIPSKPWSTHPMSLDELYHALQQRFVGPEGEARLQTLRSIAASTQSGDCSRHRYKRQQRRHLAVVKIPGSVHPENLPASALPSLASLISARNPEYTMGDVAMRCGCILLTMDIQEELHSQVGADDPGRQQVAHKLAASARLWLQETQLADQLPAAVPVYLQVNGTVLQMVREPATNAWSITNLSSATPPSLQSSIAAASPASLLPTQQHTQQQLQSGCKGCALELRGHVRMPAGFVLVGWDGTNSAPNQPAAHNSSDKGSEALQVLANLSGSGYLRTRVDAVTKSDGGGLTELQVCVSLPAEQAASTRPRALALELWQQHTLHSSSTLLLLPASLEGAAAELQLLPWAEEDVAEYVHDLAKWLHQHAPPCLSGSTPAQLRSSPCAWETGQQLLRQSVLWGLPAVSTLLLEGLMALPSAPAMPFTHTAHAPDLAPAAHPPPPEELGLDDLGGLLHLALLCPASSSMLAAVLDWGRRWGAREPGFAWRWCERSRAGFSPLDTLATLPRSSRTLQLVLSDPEQGRAVLGAALARAHGGNPCADTGPRALAHTGPHACGAPQARIAGKDRGLAAQAARAAAAVSSLSTDLCPGMFLFAPKPSQAVRHAASAAARAWAATAVLPAKMLGLLAGSGGSSSSSSSGGGGGGSSGGSSSNGNGSASSSSSSSTSAKMSSRQEDQTADFHKWANLQAASIAQKWCMFYALQLLAAVLRNAWASGSVLEANYNLCLLALAYGLGSLTLPSYPQHTEVFMVIVTIARTCWVLGAGSGWFHLGNSVLHMLNIRAEYPCEILLMSTLEQVRFSWILPMRSLMFICYMALYRTIGRPFPIVEAAVVNLVSLAVAKVMESRMRMLFECACRRKRMSGETVSCPEAQLHQQLKTD